MPGICEHLREAVIPSVAERSRGTHAPDSIGCEECLKIGGQWVHLRECLTCGHVGCCDSSPNTHATKHYQATKHPVIRSAQPGEDWRWCFIDQAMA
jgi:uncharacterized UBP type Zn finger protein